MTFEEALEYIRICLQIQFNRELTFPEQEILRSAWDKLGYNDLADGLYMSSGYIKQLASHLWEEISLVLGEKVTKANFRYFMDQRLPISPTIDQNLLENQTISDFIPSNFKILFILKEQNLLSLILSLKHTGYQVKVADHQKIMNRQIDHSPDLIILDITQTSITNGHHICSIFSKHQLTSGIPVVVLSDSENIEDKVRAFKTGVIDYITKPFNPQEVIMRLQNHLALQQQKYLLKQEIEHQKETNQIISQSRALLTNLLNSTLDGIAAFSAIRNSQTGKIEDFNTQIFNPAFAHLLGYENELITRNKDFKQLFNKIKPGLFNSLVEVIETGKTLEQNLVWKIDQNQKYFCLKAVKFGDGFSLILCCIREPACELKHC